VATPRSAALAPRQLSDLARPFGLPARTVDGMDLEAVSRAAAEMVSLVRGGGPAFLECVSLRFRSHSTTARETRSRAELTALRERCPIARTGAALVAAGVMDEAGLAGLAREVVEVVRAALAFADAAPRPAMAEALTDVW
jgi:pyruvate dehydrogenase E1 component alpha subunit